MNNIHDNRRPIKSRNTQWAISFSKYLANKKISPNKISIFSIFFAIISIFPLFYIPQNGGIFLFAFFILLRLLCNLFDGMVALELNENNPLGKIYNEFPDRITDMIFILAFSYYCHLPLFGFIATVAAIGTAYVRVFGGSIGLEQDFSGPQSKSQRMAVLIFSCILGQFELWLNSTHYIMQIGLIFMTIGTIITCINRTITIKNKLIKE